MCVLCIFLAYFRISSPMVNRMEVGVNKDDMNEKRDENSQILENRSLQEQTTFPGTVFLVSGHETILSTLSIECRVG